MKHFSNNAIACLKVTRLENKGGITWLTSMLLLITFAMKFVKFVGKFVERDVAIILGINEV